MMKLIFLLIGLTITIMVIVNVTSSSPTDQYIKERCTRYCHNKGCPHFRKNFSTYQDESPFFRSLHQLYWANIKALKQNGLGLTYQEVNLLLYVVIFPCVTVLLTWGALRKQKSL